MLFDMVCSCGAGIQISGSEDFDSNAVWVLLNRFVNAHVKCGFATPLHTDTFRPAHPSNVDPSDG